MSIRSLLSHFKPKCSISTTKAENEPEVPKPKSKLEPVDNNNHNPASGSETTSNNNDHGVANALYKSIDQDLVSLKEYVDHVNAQINKACQTYEELKKRGSSDETELDELKKLEKDVVKLKSLIPSQHRIPSADHSNHKWPDINQPSGEMLHPKLYKGPKFVPSIEPEDINVALHRLPDATRCCLLFFLNFPPMSVIKRRLLIYWWIGLDGGLVIDRARTTYGRCSLEEYFNETLNKLIAKGFVEPVHQKYCSLFPDSYRVSHSVHFALRKERHPSWDNSVYALGQDIRNLRSHRYTGVINFDEAIIDCGHELSERNECIRVVYLGRWQNSATHHIEVANTKVLDVLRNMKILTFLSLQGISLITELPSFISELINLEILDLRACHNLEAIPDQIGLLKNLTHLDMTDCYFLEFMPKSLANLSLLQVLKGFFIGDSKDKQACTLDDLAGLRKLRKLNIYTSVKDLPTDMHLSALQKFKALEKLTISWGGCSLLGGNEAKDDVTKSPETEIERPGIKGRGKNIEETAKEAVPPRDGLLKRSLTNQPSKPLPTLPSTLQKLDLQCFWGTSPPNWLRPANLKQLKKLYVRGGKLCDLGQFQKENDDNKWTVEILRLKYLSELQMNWEDLNTIFPKLVYLHKEECPKLINFPFDESVGWVNIIEEVQAAEEIT